MEAKGKQSEKRLENNDVDFNAKAVAGAWEAAEELPACVAAALVNEFTDKKVGYWDGVESDRDVIFSEAEIMVEEKAVGVCDRETAEKYAPLYVELDRYDNKVLAMNPAQIFTDWIVPN